VLSLKQTFRESTVDKSPCLQMEFCEKSTLRHCIDDLLYLDMDRVWRLFREIIEGLVHIHDQVSKLIDMDSVWRLFREIIEGLVQQGSTLAVVLSSLSNIMLLGTTLISNILVPQTTINLKKKKKKKKKIAFQYECQLYTSTSCTVQSRSS
jgi:hypothetical protein